MLLNFWCKAEAGGPKEKKLLLSVNESFVWESFLFNEWVKPVHRFVWFDQFWIKFQIEVKKFYFFLKTQHHHHWPCSDNGNDSSGWNWFTYIGHSIHLNWQSFLSYFLCITVLTFSFISYIFPFFLFFCCFFMTFFLLSLFPSCLFLTCSLLSFFKRFFTF